MKKILFIQHKAPYGSESPSETLDAALVCAAFGQTVSLLFQGDGVWQLLPEQQGQALERKTLIAQLGALPLYDIEHIYADADSLRERGLEHEQLGLPVTVLEADALRELVATQHSVLRF
ncbi:MAG: sulfurtransferase complex subunit TusC [Moraxellaceae bacterium]|nr:sulfurtransferase complex subunit TusC [Moraxellaceae bacterium]